MRDYKRIQVQFVMTCSIKIKKNLNFLFLRHVDPFVRMLHIWVDIGTNLICTIDNLKHIVNVKKRF